MVTFCVEPVDRALDRLERLSQTGARAWAEARRPMARARARWWSTWRRIVVASRITVSARSGAVRGGGVGDHGQRRLQRMGEVAGVAPRLLGLVLAMREQLRSSPRPAARSRAANSRRSGSCGRERIAATARRTRRSGHRP